MSSQGTQKIVALAVGILLVFALISLALGTGFHWAWKGAQKACREVRTAQGDFVEPEVFGNALGFLFDATFWPVYVWANMYHDGTPFATPCTH